MASHATSSTQTEESGPVKLAEKEESGVLEKRAGPVTQGSKTEEVLVLTIQDQDRLLEVVEENLIKLVF